MQAHRTQAVVAEDRSLTLEKLPFPAGEAVEVLVYPAIRSPSSADRYPLQGSPIRYEDPTAPVATSDWDALQ